MIAQVMSRFADLRCQNDSAIECVEWGDIPTKVCQLGLDTTLFEDRGKIISCGYGGSLAYRVTVAVIWLDISARSATPYFFRGSLPCASREHLRCGSATELL